MLHHNSNRSSFAFWLFSKESCTIRACVRVRITRTGELGVSSNEIVRRELWELVDPLRGRNCRGLWESISLRNLRCKGKKYRAVLVVKEKKTQREWKKTYIKNHNFFAFIHWWNKILKFTYGIKNDTPPPQSGYSVTIPHSKKIIAWCCIGSLVLLYSSFFHPLKGNNPETTRQNFPITIRLGKFHQNQVKSVRVRSREINQPAFFPQRLQTPINSISCI